MSERCDVSDVVTKRIHRYCSECLADQTVTAKVCYRGCTGKGVRIIEESLEGNENQPCVVPSKALCVKHPDLSGLG